MVAIGMPQGFEWFFLFLVLGVPFALAFLIAFFVVRRRHGTARGFMVTPDPPDDRPPAR
jgi:hypothetical protein